MFIEWRVTDWIGCGYIMMIIQKNENGFKMVEDNFGCT